MILTSIDGLQNPYSRIIFLISIGDLFQTIGFLSGPFLVPEGTENSMWGRGTITTCEVAGFFLQFGNTLVHFYTVFLTFYFLKRVKDKKTPEEFAKKYEVIVHAIIWLFTLTGCIVALARDDYNPVEGGDLCLPIDKPIDCNIHDDVECVRGKHAPIDALLFLALPMIISFLLLFANLFRFTNYIYAEEKLMRLESEHNANSGNQEKTKILKSMLCCFRRKDQNTSATGIRGRSLGAEALLQSSLYVFAYFLCFIAPIIIFIYIAVGKPRPVWFLWGAAVFSPLGGFFNILIYTRPKIQKARRKFPEVENAPWFVLFLAVIFSGGECPKEIDVSTPSDVDDSDFEDRLRRAFGFGFYSRDEENPPLSSLRQKKNLAKSNTIIGS
ncbi:hypothetical protein CTEN210_03375 [Chaetoceros tenuissimus]|uniref:G-protein coupled receptors family 1 profile domain-containing protein n=1 Tax=Chaetoceros tenuissimus TaxID=426638 RepID=A0AAD3CJ86_9STRA|nr:hypothetical protein CTEN210_03375 [Chaetoceros tenuissimus]